MKAQRALGLALSWPGITSTVLIDVAVLALASRLPRAPQPAAWWVGMAAATGGRWMYVPTAAVNRIVPRSRASLGCFISRCFAEGGGKAVMGKKLELASAAANDTEHDYASTAVRAAFICHGDGDHRFAMVGLLGVTTERKQ